MGKVDILIVDDDMDIAMITKDMLEDNGYQTAYVNSAEKAYEYLEKNQAALIILDINLPGESGFTFCKELRCNSTIPVIFVSARTSENDRIKGLVLGADDYLSKPFSLVELELRIRANLRRAYGSQNEELLSFGAVTMNVRNHEVKKNGKVISLSLKEYDLLRFLVTHPNQAFTKEALLAQVWGAFSEVEVSTVSVHIRWLREKCEENPANPVYIKTVWGIGYQFVKGE